MTVKLLVFLIIGTVAMGIPILIMSDKYRIPKWKAMVLTVLLTVAGTIGTFIMYYIENRQFGGLSFYGAVFLVPVIFLVAAPLLRISYGKAMDLCAVGECIMLALMKIHCIIGGCCLGRVLCTLSDGTIIRFPSRLAEMVVAVILFIILLRWALSGRNHNRLYPWYMVMYGFTRFLLNILREAWTEKEVLLPIGNVWSIVSIVMALICFWIIRKRIAENNIEVRTYE